MNGEENSRIATALSISSRRRLQWARVAALAGALVCLAMVGYTGYRDFTSRLVNGAPPGAAGITVTMSSSSGLPGEMSITEVTEFGKHAVWRRVTIEATHTVRGGSGRVNFGPTTSSPLTTTGTLTSTSTSETKEEFLWEGVRDNALGMLRRPVSIALLAGCALFITLNFVARARVRASDRVAGACKVCGYLRGGLAVCPECGQDSGVKVG